MAVFVFVFDLVPFPVPVPVLFVFVFVFVFVCFCFCFVFVFVFVFVFFLFLFAQCQGKRGPFIRDQGETGLDPRWESSGWVDGRPNGVPVDTVSGNDTWWLRDSITCCRRACSWYPDALQRSSDIRASASIRTLT